MISAGPLSLYPKMKKAPEGALIPPKYSNKAQFRLIRISRRETTYNIIMLYMVKYYET
jgi:hypothetical protein